MFTIIQARDDVGFVLPSLSSIDPLDYLPFDNSKIIDYIDWIYINKITKLTCVKLGSTSVVSEKYDNDHRVKRQSQSVISFRGAQRYNFL